MNFVVGLTLLAAEHKAAPLIDIDGTLWVQLVLFIILFFVLKSFVFKPFLAVESDRYDRIEGMQTAAQDLDAKAKQKFSDYQRRLDDAKKEISKEKAALYAEGNAKVEHMLAEARQRAEQQQQATRSQLSEFAADAEKNMRAQADDIALLVASKVLGRQL